RVDLRFGIIPGVDRFFGDVLFDFVIEIGQGVLDEFHHPVTVRGRNGTRFAQAKFMKLCQRRRMAHAFRLVDGEHHTLARLAQQLGDFVIVRVDTRAGIDDEDDDIGFSNGLMRLPRHFAQDAIFRHGFEAAGVDRYEGVAAHPPLAVVPIAGQAREIGDQRRTRTRDAIEEGGLADVRPTYERHDRLETWFAQFTLTITRLPLPACTRTPARVPTSGDTTAPPPTLRRPRSSPLARERKCT